MARRAGEGAGAAALAAGRPAGPVRIFEAAGQKLAHRGKVEPRLGPGACLALSAARGSRPAGEQGPAFFGQSADFQRAVAEVVEHRVRAAGIVRAEPTEVQKQCRSCSRQASVTTVVSSRRRL